MTFKGSKVVHTLLGEELTSHPQGAAEDKHRGKNNQRSKCNVLQGLFDEG